MPMEKAGGLWRSEDMSAHDIVVPRELLRETVVAIGSLGCSQVIDLNKTMAVSSRPFATEQWRCDEGRRCLNTLSKALRENGMTNKKDSEQLYNTGWLEGQSFQRVLDELAKAELRYRNLSQVVDNLRERQTEAESTLASGAFHHRHRTLSSATSRLVISGIVDHVSEPSIRRLALRVTRGNALLLAEPFTLENTRDFTRTLFGIFLPSETLANILRRLLQSQKRVTLFPPSSLEEAALTQTHMRVQQLRSVFDETSHQLRQRLSRIAARLPAWKHAVQTESRILNTMNSVSIDKSNAVMAKLRLWVPDADLPRLLKALEDVSTLRILASTPEPLCLPAFVSSPDEDSVEGELTPTLLHLSPGLAPFQGITDAYGVPRYKEVNPGVLGAVMFPYLFGIMYGDAGHGSLVMLIGVVMFIANRLLQSDPSFSGRYLVLALGAASTYMGLLYNDCFGLTLDLAPSSFNNPSPFYIGAPSFGVDVGWTEASNRLDFYNSFKMKCAIVIGVLHMLSGLMLSLLNYRRRRDRRSIAFRFIPETLFLSCTFGYMAFLIVLKWFTAFPQSSKAPSLLAVMTDFFLSPGTLNSEPLFHGQATIQLILLCLAVVQVPLMLIGPPLAAWFDNVDISEDIIHSLIHTIEYVLGCVSNTASYLRLWALSLAHAQLSEVFLNFVLVPSIGADGGSGLILTFGVTLWFAATIGVLLCMETLGAFLHAVRLTWLEWGSKFYAADGVAFQAFNLE